MTTSDLTYAIIIKYLIIAIVGITIGFLLVERQNKLDQIFLDDENERKEILYQIKFNGKIKNIDKNRYGNYYYLEGETKSIYIPSNSSKTNYDFGNNAKPGTNINKDANSAIIKVHLVGGIINYEF